MVARQITLQVETAAYSRIAGPGNNDEILRHGHALQERATGIAQADDEVELPGLQRLMSGFAADRAEDDAAAWRFGAEARQEIRRQQRDGEIQRCDAEFAGG